MDRANRLNGKSAVNKSVNGSASSNPAIATTTADCGIAFMAKASAPGRAKTRLVPPLTFEEAAVLNTAFLQDVADNVLLAAHDAERHGGIAGYAAYGPPGSEDFFRRTLPNGIALIEAWRPNFGDCLLHTIEEIFARGHASAVVLNSDSPTLPTAFLVETAAALARPGDRAVLGPSSDGGYYLLGLKTAHRHMFENIAWSTAQVAKQTLERAHEIGLDVHRLPVWYDVDDIDGLRRLHAELSERPDARRGRSDKNQPHHAVHTAALMNSMWRNHDFNRRAAALFEAEPLRA
jgi:rSAM/selenodomain-associated transferase 1